MKKHLFLGIGSVFLIFFFWNFSKISRQSFHLYVLLENLFSLNNSFFSSLAIIFSLLGGYVLCLLFYSFLSNSFSPKLLLIFLPTQFMFLILRPSLEIWAVNFIFILFSILFFNYINNQQETYVRVNFIEITSKSISKFSFYCLLIICSYSFVLNNNTNSSLIPKPLLKSILAPIQNSLLSSTGLNLDETQSANLNLNSSLCEQLKIETTACIKEMQALLQANNLDTLAESLNLNSASELSFIDIITNKIDQLFAPYTKYLPYITTLTFFSLLYPFIVIIVMFYTLIAGMLYFIFQRLQFIQVDVRSAAQEFLK